MHSPPVSMIEMAAPTSRQGRSNVSRVGMRNTAAQHTAEPPARMRDGIRPARRWFGARMPRLRARVGSEGAPFLTPAINRFYAAQVPCRPPSPYSEGPVPGTQLAGLRGRAAAARVVDDLGHRGRRRGVAGGGADHARRAGALFGSRDRDIADP